MAVKTEMFAGYTIELNPVVTGTFKVFTAKNERYIVDPSAMTCGCDGFRFNQHKPFYFCKHLRGLRSLLRQQIAEFYSAQEHFAAMQAKLPTFQQKASCEASGQQCINLATELENALIDLHMMAVQSQETMGVAA